MTFFPIYSSYGNFQTARHPELNAIFAPMKNEIEIPIQKEEDMVAANLRRDNYSRIRDLQAQEFNTAIAGRLLVKDKSQVKCDKCGKEFTAETIEGFTKCPECR